MISLTIKDIYNCSFDELNAAQKIILSALDSKLQLASDISKSTNIITPGMSDNGFTEEELNAPKLDDKVRNEIKQATADMAAGFFDPKPETLLNAAQIFGNQEEPKNTETSIIPPDNSDKVDCTGLPWDARIHSVNKTKTRDGHWRKIKGVNDLTVKKIEAELRGDNPIAQQEVPLPPQTPIIPPTPVIVVPPPPPSEPEVETFGSIMLKISEWINGGRLTSDKLIEIIKSFNLNNVAELQFNPSLLPKISQRLQESLTNAS